VDFLSLLVFLVSAIGLPYAVAAFVDEQRKKREDKRGADQNFSNACFDFLEVVPNNASLQSRTRPALLDPTSVQLERMAIIFDILVSLFGRACLVAYKARMDEREQRRWQTWHDLMSGCSWRGTSTRCYLPSCRVRIANSVLLYPTPLQGPARRTAFAADAANPPSR
jgi:hypothetical protein